MKKLAVMKRTMLTFGLAVAMMVTPIASGVVTANAASSSIKIDAKHFPDKMFRKYVKKFDKDKNGSLSKAERAKVKKIVVSNKKIKNLKGVEYFTGLTKLDCSDNQLKSLNVNKNTKLTNLDCSDNKLKTLNVSKNTKLTSLDCSDNQLKSLNVNKNTKLTVLSCTGNQLSKLTVSKNAKLTKLDCSDNKLKSLDVSKNTKLKVLYCYNNQLGNLDVSKNTQLTALNCGETVQVTPSGLDVFPFDYKEPSSDVKLFDAASFTTIDNPDEYKLNKSNEAWWLFQKIDSDENYKYVFYDSATKKFSTWAEVWLEDEGVEYSNDVMVEKDSFESALKDAVGVRNGWSIYTPTSDTTYILIFKEDATKMSDVLYTCKYNNVMSHADIPTGNTEDNNTSDESKNYLKVDSVEKIVNEDGSCHGAIFKLSWNIDPKSLDFSNDYINGFALDGQALTKITKNNKLKDSCEVKISALDNGTHTITICTKYDYQLDCKYKVDFCKAADTAVVPDKVKLEVSFSGYPKSDVYTGEEVTLKMNTTVDSSMLFDGIILGDGEYGKSFEFTVTENGTYTYSAESKGNTIVEDRLTIDFFKDPSSKSTNNYNENTDDYIGNVDDPINLPLGG